MQSSLSAVKPDEQIPLQLLQKGFTMCSTTMVINVKILTLLLIKWMELTNAMSHFQHTYAEIRTETWRQITYNQDTDA